MKIQRFECNPLQENCYVVSDETSEAAIIDCGALYAEEKQAIRQYIEAEGLRPVVLLNTHGHFDHAFATPIYIMCTASRLAPTKVMRPCWPILTSSVCA